MITQTTHMQVDDVMKVANFPFDVPWKLVETDDTGFSHRHNLLDLT